MPDRQQDVTVQLRAERHQDQRRYNLPNANEEIAAIIPGDGSEECCDHRDIILHLSIHHTQACIMFCFFLMERMAGITTSQHNLDLRGNKEALRLAKEPTMHIAFMYGQECNLHYFGVENCFSNML